MSTEKEIQKILERNKRVELDKAWETSNFRRIIIATGTYILSLILCILIEAPNPFIAAFVPTMGFVLSTLTLPFLKKLWVNKKKNQ
ncbi:hypothetical protein KKF81_05595 [Candidatus Micrarchaeota archaeon]|nr:hypothetical protein [Candidatus Micrarchaeota archaeon]MBU1166402.1 hypothetical protein [Candidatus Micrarchaeota archaeon]MBU1886915.1 hypothetical protein [Candidatus Micrarchaeota archaeon]